MSFEVLSVFEPLARLVSRSAMLDGSVPLRVAQACVPLLEGNALGRQVVFRKRLVARSRLGRRSLEANEALAEIDRAHRAAVPYLAAHGWLREKGAWHAQLSKRWWWVERGVLRVWTGLCVRPREGTWLRVTGPGSRAPLGLRVRTSFVADDDSFVPLVVDFDAIEDGTRLEGEVATVVPVVPDVRVDLVALDAAPELAERHAAFYDAKYFATKKGEVTRKYRRLVGRESSVRREKAAPRARGTTSPARVRVAYVAGPPPEVVRVEHVVGSRSTAPGPAPAGRALEHLRFSNAVGFRAHFDGNTLDVTPDKAGLERGARAVDREIARVLGSAFRAAHEGSLLYLTKYFTPHPHGEPHFFVKPWAFTETPPGWSSILEGARGDGWDVMRGVVWTDRFHATPAVFQLVVDRVVRIAAGVPLLDVVAVPRSLLDEEVAVVKDG